MPRSSDEHSTRADLRMSSLVEPQVQFASHVEHIEGDDCSRNVISEAERAQIWAVLSKETSKSSSLHHGHGDLSESHNVIGGGGGKDGSLSRLTNITTNDDKSSTKRASKVKKFGSAFKRIFMNDQTVPTNRSRRRDSWDDIYRCKDVDKVRPVHEEYGAL